MFYFNIILTVFLVSQAKVSSQLLPELKYSPPSKLVSDVSRIAGNAASSVVNNISNPAIAFTRALKINGELPILINDRNIVDQQDILNDYDLGIGDEDANLNATSVLRKYQNKPVEEHEVVTEDGYVLKLFRVVNEGPVVFLMHGLLGSADDYLVAGPESGLAYLLAERGYDVWLGNARGNVYSRKNLRMQPSEAKFWDFSWHEIGVHDLPTMIDYVLEKTGKQQLKYVGYSQGTTSFFVMASVKPEYNEKISQMIALSPVAFMGHVKSPVIRLLSVQSPVLHVAIKGLGVHEVMRNNALVKNLGPLLCGTGRLSVIMCGNILFLTVGFGFDQFNFKLLPVMMGRYPAGAAVKQFVHYGQGIVSKEFRAYDYGIGNKAKYGTSKPPNYDVEKITTPGTFFCGDNDWLSQSNDVDLLFKKIPNVTINKIPFEPFNHIDFIIAKDIKDLCYNKVLEILK